MQTTYLTRADAREYLKEKHGIALGRTGLENMAYDGKGPKYARIAGRVLYTREWLDAWVAAEAARPVVRRGERRSQSKAAAQAVAPSRAPSLIGGNRKRGTRSGVAA
jgi:hypothetical protein